MTYQIHQRDAELRGEARGRAEGEAEGEARGKVEKARETAKNLYGMGLEIDKISIAIGYATDTVRNWLGLAPA